jgi:flagellar motor switch/type III secretory pathway protein FliN
LVANGAREVLARMLAAEIDVEVLEPALPDAAARRALLEGAVCYRVRGRACDGFVIVRPADARRLVALAFGEPEGAEAPLSPIERATLDRLVRGLAPLCAPLCGPLGAIALESHERAAGDVATYFEVRTTGGGPAAIGFALTADPAEEIAEPLALEQLADVPLAGSVTFAEGAIDVAAFSRLAPGSVIPFHTRLDDPGTLCFGGVAFATGECGEIGGRRAIVLGRA